MYPQGSPSYLLLMLIFFVGLFLFILKYSNDWFSSVEDEEILIIFLFLFSTCSFYYVIFILSSYVTFKFYTINHNFHSCLILILYLGIWFTAYSFPSFLFFSFLFPYSEEKFMDILFWVSAHLRCLISLYLKSLIECHITRATLLFSIRTV